MSTAVGGDGVGVGDAAARLFAGVGELRARCRALDWAATPLGPVEGWPTSLRTAAALVLAAPTPMIVLWGPDLVQLYNDGYAAIMGPKHPAGLGTRNIECWPEVWDFTGPVYAGVRERGEAFTFADQRLVLERHGRPEETFFTLTYSPVFDEAGAVGGVFVTVIETTAAVRARTAQAAERERTVAALAASEARFRTVHDASPHGLVLLRPVCERTGDAASADAAQIVDFRIEYVNAAGARLTGQRAAAMVGRTLLTLFPATRQLGLFDAYVRVIETGIPWENDVHYIGDGLDAGYQLAAVRVGEGADAELVLLYADATARLAGEAERDRLLAELGAERERLRALILTMPAPLALLDGPEHRFTLVNDAYKRVSGGGRDVTGLTPPEAFPEIAGSGIYELFDQVYATGEPWDGPETLVRFDRDGTGVIDTWFDLRFAPVRDAAGRVTAILNFNVDVTEQVRARHEVERLLAESEGARAEAEAARARSDAVLASIADAFYLLDRAWRFTYVNAAAEPLLQTTRAALLGRTLWEAFPDVAGSRFEGPYRAAMEEGRVTSAEAYFPPLGTWFDVRTYPWTGGLMVHFRDIGARKEAEAEREHLLAAERAARRRTERLLAASLALTDVATPDAVAAVIAREGAALVEADAGAVYVRTSAAGAEADGDGLRLLSETGFEAPARAEFDWVPLGAAVPVADAARTGEPVLLEDRAALAARYPALGASIARAGRAALLAAPLRAGDRITGALAFAYDAPRAFTAEDRAFAAVLAQQCAQALERASLFAAERAARAAAEAARAEAEDARTAAEAANQAKSQFLAVMSHELRTPLNAIGGYAELMEMGIRGPVTALQREDLARIQKSQRHLLGLVNEVLNYAKLETGTVHFDLAPVRVHEALAGAEALVAPQAQAKGLALMVHDCPPELAVRADTEKLRQVLVNLLSNAVKFTEPGGRVDLACAAVRETEDGDRVYVTVRDTGIGIAPDQLTRIFEPFVQVRSDLTRTAEGTGLGLAISRDLARGMGGDLTAESMPGVGSVFTLTLPAA